MPKRTALLIGRFQPFHLGHLESIKQILKECGHLIIGIGSSQYANTIENPFSSDERCRMIKATLSDNRIPEDSYEIVLVPDIHDKERWVRHAVSLCPKFDVVYTRNRLVASLFKEQGYEVKNQSLFLGEEYNATSIRERISHDSSWKELLPLAVVKILESIGAVERLKSLKRHH